MTNFIRGNEAVVIGALYAGCDVYFGYPITPASEIAHAAARWFPAVGREFLQAECETASINMVYGAAAVGGMAMTATSGPGMSLMQEGISYMAGAELPGVIVNIMRAGPGLGNIYPEQADYNQSVKGGGHGNYQCLVLAPASVQEMCDFTMHAFTLSFKYRTPAIVLADGLLGQMMETLTLPEQELVKPDTAAWSVQGTAATRKNLITSIYLDTTTLETHNLKLQAKYQAMRSEAQYESILCDDADIVLVAYGISSRIAQTAAETLRAEGVKVGVFRPLTLNPFPVAGLCSMVNERKIMVVELSAGQLHNDVVFHLANSKTAYKDIGLCTRMGGTVVTVGEVVEQTRRFL